MVFSMRRITIAQSSLTVFYSCGTHFFGTPSYDQPLAPPLFKCGVQKDRGLRGVTSRCAGEIASVKILSSLGEPVTWPKGIVQTLNRGRPIHMQFHNEHIPFSYPSLWPSTWWLPPNKNICSSNSRDIITVCCGEKIQVKLLSLFRQLWQ